MTTPQAIVAGSVIIAVAILGARIIAPYQIASGTAVSWRVNTVTGAVMLCNSVIMAGREDEENRCR